MKRKWREIHSRHFLIFTLFRPSLSISYIKNCLILLQVLNTALLSRMSQKITYELWEKNYVSNSLRQSSASCEGLGCIWLYVAIFGWNWLCWLFSNVPTPSSFCISLGISSKVCLLPRSPPTQRSCSPRPLSREKKWEITSRSLFLQSNTFWREMVWKLATAHLGRESFAPWKRVASVTVVLHLKI